LLGGQHACEQEHADRQQGEASDKFHFVCPPFNFRQNIDQAAIIVPKNARSAAHAIRVWFERVKGNTAKGLRAIWSAQGEGGAKTRRSGPGKKNQNTRRKFQNI
jgi:hypothetical protein